MNNNDRLLKVLSFVASNDNPVYPKKISADLHIPLSSVYRILNTLIKWEFITPSSKQGTYTLGAQSLKGRLLNNQFSLFGNEVDSLLFELSKTTGESVAIVVSDYRETICIKMVDSIQALRCSFLPGRVNSLIHGASGKTLLAFKIEKTQDLIIQNAFPDNLAAQSIFKNELNLIKETGYGRSIGEIDSGVLGIAAPIFKNNNCIAVITLMAPHFRADKNEILWIKYILKCANSITSIIQS